VEEFKRVVKAVKEFKRVGIKSLKDKEWEIEDRVVMKERQIYIPKKKLKGEVIWLYHNTPVGEHGKRWKTMELITRNY